MKKFLIRLLIIVVVIASIVFFVSDWKEALYVDESLLTSKEYTTKYYYNQLDEEQKLIYIKIDTRIKELTRDIHLGFVKNVEAKKDVERVLTAIYNDRPEYYYLPQDYNVKSLKFGPIEYTILKLNYTVKDERDREVKDLKLKQAVDAIVYDNVSENMTDIEKAIKLHDALVARVEYYNFENIDTIPAVKHTAYEALINSSGVCDGITKAYMLLLEKVGIETIMVTGVMGDVAHAWNIVKLDDEYYHIDATSDSVELGGKYHTIHRYFNLNDAEIQRTHKIDEDFDIIPCEGTKYEYYRYKDYYIDYTEDFKRKLIKVINAQFSSPIVELKLSELYSAQSLLEEMYFLDYNKWETEDKDIVKYHKIEEVYVFENNNKTKLY